MGVGLAIYSYLNNLENDRELSKILYKIINIYKNKVTLSGGAFSGFSGLMISLVLGEFKDNELQNLKKRFLNTLKLYTGVKDNDLLFAGDANYRFSFDISTGSSGVALMLECIEKQNPYLWIPVLNSKTLL
ncbi:hypothetical protein DOS78_06610 [Staphylococcus felis]|nr:lanthionine synthetase LanC family protein [Staphylococcus felis]REI03369.1 hypothetical protein DOS65_04815 [Staphylococcus felis]REI10026.1 hypothetical protein DOS66_06400 [Staphylococcus felis]REI23415.1 hypothetical protein DOS78_06610 [Staphylococcus felis]